MASISLPSLSRSSGFLSQSSEIATLLEQARTVAMAENTYVWVGFNTDSGVQMAVVASKSTEDDLTAGNLSPLSKTRTFDQLKMTPSLASTLDLNGSEDLNQLQDISTGDISSFTIGGKSKTYKYVIRFGPMGDAVINTSTRSPWIEVGLQPVRGAERNGVSLQINGLTGNVRMLRP